MNRISFHIILIMLLANVAAKGQKDSLVVPKGSVAEKLANRTFDDKELLLKQEFTGGIMLHTQGWGINLRRSKNKTYKKKRVIELDIVSMKHAKEIKVVNPYFDNTESYVYGRLYSLLVSRLGYGRQNIMFERFDRGVEIRYLYIGGVSVGWAKPVYLEIGKGAPPIYEDGVTTQRYDPDNPEHDVAHIVGSSTFFKGFEKLQVNPGFYGKFGVSFDYSKKQRNITAIEAGVIVDAYFRVIKQMANTRNNQVFVNLYISLNFGKKWYKH